MSVIGYISVIIAASSVVSLLTMMVTILNRIHSQVSSINAEIQLIRQVLEENQENPPSNPCNAGEMITNYYKEKELVVRNYK